LQKGHKTTSTPCEIVSAQIEQVLPASSVPACTGWTLTGDFFGVFVSLEVFGVGMAAIAKNQCTESARIIAQKKMDTSEYPTTRPASG